VGARSVHPLAVDELDFSGKLQKAQMDLIELPCDMDFRL